MMKTFKTHLVEDSTPGKNTHMMHLEDQVLYGGVEGARQAINALRSLRNMLAGESTRETDVSQKWDGAPSLFCGEDPRDGEFFVAKKGIFNKTPKVYKSHAEIDADTTGDLAKKLKIAYTELKKLGIKGVIQGDILFTKGDLSNETIKGKKYVTFHPNTIVYAVPANSPEAEEIRSANLGIVFHTSYTGKSFETLKASYGVDVSRLKKSSSVWVQDAMLQDLSGTATLTKGETDEITELLSEAGTIFQKISGDTLRSIENNQEFARMLEQFNNMYVRRGEKVKDTRLHVRNLISWIHDKFSKEEADRKTEKGKKSVRSKRDELLSFFSPVNEQNLRLVFDLQNAIVGVKEIIISKLDQLNRLKTFVKTSKGFRTTGTEGFVAIDRLQGGAVKLVNRLEFSQLNFSTDIIKGW
jgi:hypothetical protein